MYLWNLRWKKTVVCPISDRTATPMDVVDDGRPPDRDGACRLLGDAKSHLMVRETGQRW